MSQAILERLLAGTLPDPDGAGSLAVTTRAVAIAPSLAGREAALVGELRMGDRLAVVTDPTTRKVLGARVAGALGALSAVEEIVLDDRPHADMARVEALRARTDGANALIAVGAGTINDLCKYAAYLDDKPYAVFGTAPSMNGYSSVSAAITESGHKKSLPARAPLGVFLDLRVLAAAPPRMIQSGIGDSICRPTAQADWLLAHLLLAQPYRTAPFVLLREDETQLFASAGPLIAGDLGAMEVLARTLVMSGFGMAICGGSYPASQGEHLISHYIDMMGDPAWPTVFHGEHIAVTTLTMARLQETILGGAAPKIGATGPDRRRIEAHFGPALGASCWQAFAKKAHSAAEGAALTAKLAERWEDIRAALRPVMRPSAEIRAVLKAAGAPTSPTDIRVPTNFYRQAVVHAREIRDRYTFLDLAGDAGQLDKFAASA